MTENQPGYGQQPTQQGHYQQGPPPHGYYQQGPPPKKKHTVRNVLLVILGLCVLAFGGCMALLGTAANEVDKAIKAEQANDKPRPVDEGVAFTHDDFQVDAGWKVVRDFGGADIKGLHVTNDAQEPRHALLTFRFYKGSENLAEVECSSNQMQPGESSALDCFSTASKYPKGYKTIKVSDAF